MSFSDDLRRFSAKNPAKLQAVFDGVCEATFGSIVEGSPITGAPGQPVSTGFLKGSWQRMREAPLRERQATNVAYARVIEDNLRSSFDPAGVLPVRKPVTEGGTRFVKSTVGGHHSAKLTVAGFQRIVDAVTREVAGND